MVKFYINSRGRSEDSYKFLLLWQVLHALHLVVMKRNVALYGAFQARFQERTPVVPAHEMATRVVLAYPSDARVNYLEERQKNCITYI